MSPPDDKQNRLSTLTQDVIAVPKKPAPSSSRPAERERIAEREHVQEKRAVPPTQDVFRVPAPPPSVPMPSARGAAPVPAAGGAIWAVGAIAVVAVAVAVYALQQAAPAPVADPQIAVLAAELKLANERVQKLEAKLGAAAADAQNISPASQAGLLQISAGLRELRNDLDKVSNEQGRLASQLGEIRGLAGGASKDAKIALSQVDQVGARLATVTEQVGSAPRVTGSAGTVASGDVAAQLKGLNQKTDKMAADIRQLYRLSAGQ